MLPGTSTLALAAAYGDTHPKRRAQFEKQVTRAVSEDYGKEPTWMKAMNRSLVHLRFRPIRIRTEKSDCPSELKYFRRNAASNALRGGRS